jgi:hypothetical protein
MRSHFIVFEQLLQLAEAVASALLAMLEPILRYRTMHSSRLCSSLTPRPSPSAHIIFTLLGRKSEIHGQSKEYCCIKSVLRPFLEI